MKVIFLDFDGVLNSQGSFLFEHNERKRFAEKSKVDGEKGPKGPVNESLCHVCTSNFQFVLEQYKEVKIVISSTWRELFSIDWLKEKLASYHIDSSRVIGITPSAWGNYRGAEIKMWLNEHPEVTHYVIIDDNDDGLTENHGASRFVKTSWEGGMTFAHAEELIEKLSTKNAKRLKNEKPES